MSDPEELLLVASHPLRPAVQRHPPPEEDLGGSVKVDFPSWVNSGCIYAQIKFCLRQRGLSGLLVCLFSVH